MRERIVAAALLLALAAGVAVLASAGRDDGRFAPRIDPADFTATITNPYLPLRPGNRWIYEGRSEDGFERKVVEVTDETRVVMGVPCLVVKDTVALDGQLYEETPIGSLRTGPARSGTSGRRPASGPATGAFRRPAPGRPESTEPSPVW